MDSKPQTLVGRQQAFPATRFLLLRPPAEGRPIPFRLHVTSKAAVQFVTALPEAFVWDRVLIVLACSANKDIRGIVGQLRRLPVVATVFAGAHSSPRSASAEDVAEAARDAGFDADASTVTMFVPF